MTYNKCEGVGVDMLKIVRLCMCAIQWFSAFKHSFSSGHEMDLQAFLDGSPDAPDNIRLQHNPHGAEARAPFSRFSDASLEPC